MKTTQCKCDPATCPIPICALPKELTARQIRTIMEYLDIPSKEVAMKLGLQQTEVWAALNRARKYPAYLKSISDYVRGKLIHANVQK
jgi:predicted DNA-binding protein (UPF0251 family)